MENLMPVESRKSGGWTITTWADGSKSFSVDPQNVRVLRTAQQSQMEGTLGKQ
jgi:hypothetical protein